VTKTNIELLSVEQRAAQANWFCGTADAVRQNIDYILETKAEYILILSGDQLYRMDYRKMLQVALAKDLDVVVATLAVDEKQARRMGIMKVNEDHNISYFHEKPSTAEALEGLKTPLPVLKNMGFESGSEKPYLGSMGIYLFKREALVELLQQDPREDFGKHIIPTKVTAGRIGAMAHNGYWEDIGTIESYFEANLAITQATPPFEIRDDIITRTHYLPGAKISNAVIDHSVICEGAVVEAKEITKSIIGQKSVIKQGTTIINSYIIGESEIAEECFIKQAIIDKNVKIGRRVQLVNTKMVREFDSDLIYVRDGIIIVPSGVELPEGFVF